MKKLVKQFEVLNWASLFLKKHNCEPTIAKILLRYHLRLTESEFYMMMHEAVSAETVSQFKADIIKHVKTGIPVQHLTGYEYFYGRKFIVNEHVLIPRPETEELVQHVIGLAKTEMGAESNVNIIDIGTGSGVIAITLALELPNTNVFAVDISQEALVIAKKNAQIHQANVSFFHGNYLQPIIHKKIKADYIVSNPPYIKQSEKSSLATTVKDFDPALALFANEEGLEAYQKIIKMVPKVITSNSKVVFEIGYDQGSSVCHLIKNQFPQSSVKVIQDINGLDRIVSTQL